MPKRKADEVTPEADHLSLTDNLWAHQVLPILNHQTDQNAFAKTCRFFNQQANKHARHHILKALHESPHPLAPEAMRQLVENLTQPRRAYIAYLHTKSFTKVARNISFLKVFFRDNDSALKWALLDDNVTAFLAAHPMPALHYYLLPTTVALGCVNITEYLLHQYSQRLTSSTVNCLWTVARITQQRKMVRRIEALAHEHHISLLTADALLAVAIESQDMTLIDYVLTTTPRNEMKFLSRAPWFSDIPQQAIRTGVIAIIERLRVYCESNGRLLALTPASLMTAFESDNPEMVDYVDAHRPPNTQSFYRTWEPRSFTRRALFAITPAMYDKIKMDCETHHIPFSPDVLIAGGLLVGSTALIARIFADFLEPDENTTEEMKNAMLGLIATQTSSAAVFLYIVNYLQQQEVRISIDNNFFNLAFSNIDSYRLSLALAQEQQVDVKPTSVGLEKMITSYDVTLVNDVLTRFADQLNATEKSKIVFKSETLIGMYELFIYTGNPVILDLLLPPDRRSGLYYEAALSMLEAMDHPFLKQCVHELFHSTKQLTLSV